MFMYILCLASYIYVHWLCLYKPLVLCVVLIYHWRELIVFADPSYLTQYDEKKPPYTVAIIGIPIFSYNIEWFDLFFLYIIRYFYYYDYYIASYFYVAALLYDSFYLLYKTLPFSRVTRR